jgi:hypothetical protein
MPGTVALGCGHGLQLLTVQDRVPDEGPWALYPTIAEHPIELGDLMTCVVCLSAQRVTGIYLGLVPMDHTGRLVLP